MCDLGRRKIYLWRLPRIGVSAAFVRRDSELRIETLLFMFAHRERVAPPGLVFFTYDYLGPEGVPEWAWRGWQTSDFADEWDPYTYRRFFQGAAAELPGCGPNA